MTDEELKKYSVMVGDGSGCIFQPMLSNDEYTYILTAKHLFEGNRLDGNGHWEEYTKDDYQPIDIFRLVFQNNTWAEEKIEFSFVRGETYFHHQTADAAILKIPFLDGFGKIVQRNVPALVERYFLHGYRGNFRDNVVGEKDSMYALQTLSGVGVQTQRAQLFNATMNQEDIEGMSGGGILRADDDQVSIIGIQSSVPHAHFAAGQINFVQMEYFNEIVENVDFAGLLAPLCPPFFGDFAFLSNDAFSLSVSDLNEADIAGTRTVLRDKAIAIANSDITPRGIRELFNHRLLMSQADASCLSSKHIWVAWLEFLTILNIVKFDPISSAELSSIFDTYRLKYVDVDDWTQADVLKKYMTSDYHGLRDGSTVFVSSRKSPTSCFGISRGRLVPDISRPTGANGFMVDTGLNPFATFNFVHIDTFKTKCIVEKVFEYINLSDPEIIAKLREEYNEYFN